MTLSFERPYEKALAVAIAVIVAIVVCLVAVHVYRQEATDRQAAADKADKLQEKIDYQQKVIEDANDRLADRQSEFDAWKKSHDAKVAAVHTAHDAAQQLGQHGIAINEAPSSNGAPPSYSMDPGTVLTLYKNIAQCDEDRKRLGKCEADLGDTQSIVVEKSKQLAAEKEIASRWEQAAKGGSKWRRFLRFAVPIGCATMGAVASRNQRPEVTASVTAGAAVSCGLLMK